MLLIGSEFFAQNDTLNKFNNKGKKNGYWIKYLDQNVSPVDSINSYFYGYELYDNGTSLFVYNKDWWLKQSKLSYNDSLPKKGSPILLNGIFSWYDNKDSLPSIIETYKNGYPISIEAYHKCQYHLRHRSEFVDFTKRYNNEIGTYYVESEGFNGMKKYWFRKEQKKWKARQIKE